MGEDEDEEEQDEGQPPPAGGDPAEQAYLERRNALIKAEEKASESFDKFVPYISGGALAISLTFLEKIAPKIAPQTVAWISWAWFLLVGSLLASLAGRMTSQYAYRFQVRICDDNRREELGEEKLLKSSRNVFAIITGILNWVTILLVIAGILCLVQFSLSNLPLVEAKKP
ncbi:MAG TPA: hypothetical protein VG820_08210 [Fimbriimonadaceae bacterium]|nr:hypothetical protein [Fimbriimonadaceae bacterium]